jgi:peptidoglycan hydrolase-like protein with peptidoglycan-binding domain
MNKLTGSVLIALASMLAGCATCDTSRIDNLDARLKAVESNMGKSDMTAETSSGETVTAPADKAAAITPPESPTRTDIQACLKNAGYYEGTVDGKFGPKTKKAIEEFQNANELSADGKVGPNTWNKLKKFYTEPTE